MRYINVTGPDINNGTGCRVTLWVAGCSHHCHGCHNQETWNYNVGKELRYSDEEIRFWLEKPYIKGLTLSGGDPLAQNDKDIDELYILVNGLKKDFPDKDIWIYTGYELDECMGNRHKSRLINLCDYIVDGEYKYKLRDTSLPFRGSSNQKIWKNLGDEAFEEIEF